MDYSYGISSDGKRIENTEKKNARKTGRKFAQVASWRITLLLQDILPC